MKTINKLGPLLAGDTPNTPYLTGFKLVEFFNECGSNDEYGEGFPTRWRYVVSKLEEANGTDRLRLILEEYVDPRRFNSDDNKLEIIVRDINALIKFDGYVLKINNQLYRISDTKGNLIKPEATEAIGHAFVMQQIEKSQHKIAQEDYNGAITNARTLVEAILIYAIETTGKNEIKNDGNLSNLWNRAKKSLKLEFEKSEVPEFVFQILSGLDTSLNGLAAISNNASDRHANKFRTKKHHAKLAINLAMTFSDFIVDVLNQRNK